MDALLTLTFAALIHVIVTHKINLGMAEFKVDMGRVSDSSQRLTLIKSKKKNFFLYSFGLPVLSYLSLNYLILWANPNFTLPQFFNMVWGISVAGVIGYFAWAIRDILIIKVSAIGVALFFVVMFSVLKLPEQALYFLIFVGLLRNPVQWVISRVMK